MDSRSESGCEIPVNLFPFPSRLLLLPFVLSVVSSLEGFSVSVSVPDVAKLLLYEYTVNAKRAIPSETVAIVVKLPMPVVIPPELRSMPPSGTVQCRSAHAAKNNELARKQRDRIGYEGGNNGGASQAISNTRIKKIATD